MYLKLGFRSKTKQKPTTLVIFSVGSKDTWLYDEIQKITKNNQRHEQ